MSKMPARRRAVTPWVIVALTVLALIALQFTSIETDFRAYLAGPVVLVMLLALGAWVLFFSGMSWRRRWMIVLGSIAVLVGLVCATLLLTRREGSFSGAGVPRMVWIWTPHRTVEPIVSVLKGIGPATTAPTADDFPQFMGPVRDNQVHDAKLARDWNARPPVQLWRRTTGAGWSGFAVVGNAAITMEQRGGQESTICYNLQTGEPIWSHSNAAFLQEHEGGDGPRATPTIVNGRVYTLGGLGNVDCLNLADGSVIWSRALFSNPERERLHYGQTSSPLVLQDKVIVTGGRSSPSAPAAVIWAFDPRTGEPLWHFDGDTPSYASPVVVTLAGVPQILLVHAISIEGHDLADGHLLWRYSWPGMMPKNSQALAVGTDQVFASSGYGIGSVLLKIIPDALGKQVASPVWKSSSMRTKMSNVVLRDHFIYGLDDVHLACQDVNTGQIVWERPRTVGYGQILWAGDLLLVQSESGDVALVDARPDGFTDLGHFSALTASNTCWNPMALAGHLLVVRSDREAACYRLP